MDTKYQVFISSTFEDLQEHRDQVIRAVLEMGHIPVGMEMFSAGDEQQWELIKRQIDIADYYIVISAYRYGSLDGNISYTEKEYDYAVSKSVPVLGFVIDTSTDWPPNFVDKDDATVAKLNAFKTKIKQRLVSFWSNKEDLYGKASIALMKGMTSHPRVGWVRADSVPGPQVLSELTRLSSENSSLRKMLEEIKSESSDSEEKISQTLATLQKNSRKVFIWIDRDPNEPEFKADWKPHPGSLFTIFKSISRDMIDEATLKSIGHSIAIDHANTEHYNQRHPVPSNVLNEWLSDLASLELIEPSKKRHSVNDGNEYWSLTEYGFFVIKEFRKVALKAGTISESEPEDDEITENES